MNQMSRRGISVFVAVWAAGVFAAGAVAADGKAVVTQAEGLEDKGLVVGALIQQDQVLETPPGKTVDFTINNLVGVRLLPGTRAKIASINPQRMSLLLASGNVLINADKNLKQQGTFSVATPIAVAAVRGTQFWGRAVPPEQSAKTGQATFAVREGEVELTWLKTGDKSVLRPGDAADITTGDIALMPVRRASQDEMAALEQVTQIAIAS